MASELVLVRHHGKDDEALRQTVNVIVPSFYEDPLFRWIFNESDDAQRRQKLWRYLPAVLSAAPIVGGFILDAKDWGAAMVVTCPGQKYDSVGTVIKCGGVSATLKCGLKPTYRLLKEYLAAVNECKAKVLPRSRFYDCFYVLITATRSTHRRQGLLGVMMDDLFERARTAGKPIWLESTTAYSRSQFARYGFEVVGEMKVGKGKVDKDGVRKKGGEGVTLTGMIWRPEGKGKVKGEVGDGQVMREKEAEQLKDENGIQQENDAVHEDKGKGKAAADES